MNKKHRRNVIITVSALIITLILGLYVKAQVSPVQIVNDPTNLAKIKEVLETGKQQIDKIKEQTKMLKEASDAVSKVNREIMKVKTIKTAINQQGELVSHFSAELTDVSTDAMSAEALNAYLRRIESYRTQVLDNNTMLLQLICDDVFKMSDYERLQAMNSIVENNQAILRAARQEKAEYEYLNSHLKAINNISWKNTRKN